MDLSTIKRVARNFYESYNSNNMDKSLFSSPVFQLTE
jgi:hypothetical protein